MLLTRGGAARDTDQAAREWLGSASSYMSEIGRNFSSGTGGWSRRAQRERAQGNQPPALWCSRGAVRPSGPIAHRRRVKRHGGPQVAVRGRAASAEQPMPRMLQTGCRSGGRLSARTTRRLGTDRRESKSARAYRVPAGRPVSRRRGLHRRRPRGVLRRLTAEFERSAAPTLGLRVRRSGPTTSGPSPARPAATSSASRR